MQKFNFNQVIGLGAILILIFCSCEENPSGPETPLLNLSPNNLSFSFWETEKSFRIQNNGLGALEWNIVKDPDQNWMCVSPDNGQNNGSVSVVINRSQAMAGSYTGSIYIESNAGNKELSVRADIPYFADDFSAGLANWEMKYCNAWIENGKLHYDGTSDYYFGRVIHSFDSYIPVGYAYQARMARLSNAYDKWQGLYIRLSDSGSPRITSLMLVITEKSEKNWYLLAFVSGITSPTWAILAADSYGYSDLIKLGTGEWNDLRLTVKQDKTVMVHIGNEILHSTREITYIEDHFGINIDMKCVRAELRTERSYEIMADDIAITNLLTANGFNKTVVCGESKSHLTEQHPTDELEMVPKVNKLTTVHQVFNQAAQ